MVILYEHPLSPYAQKNKIALREKGVNFELRLPDALGSGAAGGQFLTANPRAEVPALIDGDAQIFDSTVILEYIEDKWPSPALLPSTPAERAKARMIEDVMDTHYEAINWGLGEINYFQRATGELASQITQRAKAQTEGFQQWLGQQLGDNDWFNGAEFGWGDLSVIPYINGSISFGFAPAEDSALSDWHQRTMQRLSVAQTSEEATASVSGMEQVGEILKSGLFKREYRDHRLEWMIRSGGLDVVLKGLKDDNIRFSHEFT
ncbi:MAG: glutathione S-transferase family protein [Pseudomonadota bacterium]